MDKEQVTLVVEPKLITESLAELTLNLETSNKPHQKFLFSGLELVFLSLDKHSIAGLLFSFWPEVSLTILQSRLPERPTVLNDFLSYATIPSTAQIVLLYYWSVFSDSLSYLTSDRVFTVHLSLKSLYLATFTPVPILVTHEHTTIGP